MAGIGKYEGVGDFKMEAPIKYGMDRTPAMYTPYKMKKGSPMYRNFGVGSKEMQGGVAAKGVTQPSPYRIVSNTPEATNDPAEAARRAAEQLGVDPSQIKVQQGGGGIGAIARRAKSMAGALGGAGAGGGAGAVAPHGPEAHAGGGGGRNMMEQAQPGAQQRKRDPFNVFGGGGGGRGMYGF